MSQEIKTVIFGKAITPVTALVNCVNAGLIHIQEV
jgi:hypothetical protein